MPAAPREIDVLKVAQLARLTLEASEAEAFRPQLVRILEYITQLDALDTQAVEPTSHGVPLVAPLRADEARPGLPREEALAQAPRAAEGAFVVPKFVES